MKKTITLLMLACILFYTSCEESDHLPKAKKYSADVAIAWINLQQKLIKKTPGFSPGVSGRAWAYSGLALYESIVPGMPGYRSLLGHMGAPTAAVPANSKFFYWPSCANSAMAFIIKNLFASTSPANVSTIDSLEAAFNSQFEAEVKEAQILEGSANFGRLVAENIFEWSKTDGGHEGYKPQPNTYTPLPGDGFWKPTPPAFANAAASNQGNYRTFTPGLTAQTQPSSYPIPSYSPDPGSDFYNMVNEVYTISQSLTNENILTVKTWGDIPGNYNGPGHFTNIATQLIILKHLNLDEAALVYAKHGIALNDAGISCFKTKYEYNLVRPITYIRSPAMGHTTWNTIIPTPPHPEFSSAHAVVGRASSVVLESTFGKKCSFTDKTHEALYGSRTYNTLEEYAKDGAWSRVLAGIHYNPSATAGLEQGKKVGDLVNKLPFKSGHNQD
jgi:hypothetical protein